MADKEIVIRLVGPEEVVAQALDAFVKAHGWKEEVAEGEAKVPNPETREVKARAVLRSYMIDRIRAHNIAMVASQVAESLDAVQMTLEIK